MCYECTMTTMNALWVLWMLWLLWWKPGFADERWPPLTPQMNVESPSTSLGTQTNGETVKNHLWCPMNGIPRDNHRPRKSGNGWMEAGSNPELETTHVGKSTILHRVCKFLLQIHSELLQYCGPPEPSNLEGWTLELDSPPTKSLRWTQTHLFLCSSPPNPQCLVPLLDYDQHLSSCSWSGPSPNWCQWGPSPLCLLLLHFYSCTTKLQHLQLRTSSGHTGPGRMAAIPLRNSISYNHHHQSQKPVLYKRFMKVVLTTSSLVLIPARLQHHLAGDARNQNGSSGCSV